MTYPFGWKPIPTLKNAVLTAKNVERNYYGNIAHTILVKNS